MTIIPVLLCGGSGRRLWPLSTLEKPKQFHTIDHEKTLLQQTAERALGHSQVNPEKVVTTTNPSLFEQTKEQLQAINPALTNNILIEPKSKNTAAAIAFSAINMINRFGEDSVLWIMPCDHIIDNVEVLYAAIDHASTVAQEDKIVTLGIKPDHPHTGYGYIQSGEIINGHARHIQKFTEKPDKKTAQHYLKETNYFWNSGMFIANAKTLIKNFEQHAPDILDHIETKNWEAIDNIAFDKAIMEKSQNTAIIPCPDLQWNDIGNWGNFIQSMLKRRRAS